MSSPDQKISCPVCGEAAVDDYKPFCSKRCADIDLGRWLSDAYVIPGREDDDDVESPASPANEDDLPS